jgi:hypothetical protein
MKGNGKLTKEMEEENNSGKTAQYMKVIGRKI